MDRSKYLTEELHRSVFENPWHGESVKEIITEINVEHAFKKITPSTHNIIELVLHLSAWTDEVLSRFSGNTPSLPKIGDWPLPENGTEEYWQAVKEKLFADTSKLIAAIKKYPEDKLDEIVGMERSAPLGTGFSFEGLIIGLIQHNAYHSGQIALIKKSFHQ